MAGVIGSLLRDTTCDLILGEGYVVPPAEGFRPALPVEGYTDNSYAQQLAEQYPHLSDKRLHRLVDEVQADWPSAAHAWEHDPEDRDLEWFQIQPGKQLAPGMWPAPTENGRMPRLRAMQKWDHNVTHSNPPFHPICLSTRSTNPAFNLTPTATEGWYWWTHPEHTDKPYLAAHEPGAWATFDLDVNVGVIKLYALHSKTYGLGMIECTVDGGKGVTIDGWWNNEWL
jgi:hypothetical protein